MLQEELWYNRISRELGISSQIASRLWKAYMLIIEQKLNNGFCLDFEDFGYWNIKILDEYIAVLDNNKEYLIPPQICLSLNNEIDQAEGKLLLLSELNPLVQENLEIKTELLEIVSSNLSTWIKEELNLRQELECPLLGTFKKEDGEEEVLAYSFSLNSDLATRLNKDFALFRPTALEHNKNNKENIQIIKYKSLEETKYKHHYKFNGKGKDMADINENKDLLNGIEIEEKPIITESNNQDLGGEKEDDQDNKGMIYLLVLIILLAIISACFYIYQEYKINEPRARKVKVEKLSTTQNKKHIQYAPEKTKQSKKTKGNEEETSNKPEYIVVKSGQTLCSIAQEKYGNRHFWVYIYKENKKYIPDPNNLRVGTKLRLPRRDKYDINSKDNKSIKKALKLADTV